MTIPIETVVEATPIESALVRMHGAGTRRVVVVDVAGRLAGILSLDDVLDLLAEEMSTIGRLLARQEPWLPPREAPPGASDFLAAA